MQHVLIPRGKCCHQSLSLLDLVSKNENHRVDAANVLRALGRIDHAVRKLRRIVQQLITILQCQQSHVLRRTNPDNIPCFPSQGTKRGRTSGQRRCPQSKLRGLPSAGQLTETNHSLRNKPDTEISDLFCGFTPAAQLLCKANFNRKKAVGTLPQKVTV